MGVAEELLALRNTLTTAVGQVDALLGAHSAADGPGEDLTGLDRTVAIERVLEERGAPMRPVEIWAALQRAGRSGDPKMEVQVTTYDLWKRDRIDKVGRGQYVTRTPRT